MQLVLGNSDGRIEDRRDLVVNPDAGAEGIQTQIETQLAAWPEVQDVQGVGVGFGGPVHRGTGRVAISHQVAGWADFDLKGWLVDLLEVPVVVENDSNAAVLAEAVCGAGRGYNPVFFFNLGSGIGGGLMHDGLIYRGAVPGEAEFGHMVLDREGTTVESHCSGWAVDARIRALIEADPKSGLAAAGGQHPGEEARGWAQALHSGDPAARRLLDEVAGDLGLALSHAVHLFHPAVIVIGGGLAYVGEPLRAAVEEATRPLIMEVFRDVLRVRLSELGADNVPVGALLLASGKGR